MTDDWYLQVLSPETERGKEPLCVTCSDAAEVMELAALQPPQEALAIGGRGPVRIDISLVAEPCVGQKVLVHGGVALGIVTGEEAGSLQTRGPR